jgi:erythromycin esterase
MAAAQLAYAAPQPPGAVIDWIRANAIPIATPEAGHGFTDLQRIKAIVGSARLVALGEATHGTREFFQLEHRILEYLVTKLGFTSFAIEANFPECLAIDRYIMTGVGDPQTLLDGIYFWTLNTEELLDLIRWMRRYNEEPAHPHKLHFYGVDMQYPVVAAADVLAYVKKADPNLLPTVTSLIAPWADLRFDRVRYAVLDKRERAANAADLERLISVFEQAHDTLVRKTSELEYVWARHELRIIEQCEMASAPLMIDASGRRDLAMAENVNWLLAHQPPGTRMVLWAHNLHVSRQPRGANPSMGGYLQPILGKAMVVFGLAFNEGSFQAVEKTATSERLREFTVGPAPPDSLDATLAATGIPLFAIDLRRAPRIGPVGEWLRKPHAAREIGALFSDAATNAFTMLNAPAAFDAMLFVAKTTRARPNRRTRTSGPVAPKAENLDLEAGPVGQRPTGWAVPAAVLAAGYSVSATDQQPRSGKLCAVVSGAPNKPRSFGNLMQRIDATPYRGKRVRLRASVRTTGPGYAALWMRVDRQSGDVGFFENMHDRPITASQWQNYEIVGDVDADAAALNFGMMLIGEGRAWLDDVSLQAIDPAPDSSPLDSR